MEKVYLFYNPLAGGGKLLEDLELLEFVLDVQCIRCDMTRPETYETALFAIDEEDILVLCGGDGTLNRFANITEGIHRKNEIYYFPAGTNNDFAMDHGRWYGNNPFCITKELQTLPSVQMGNRTGHFLTGVVFDACGRIRRTSKETLPYNTSRAATVTVDGIRNFYDKVRFAAVMYGRHCGGGMVPDPGRRPADSDLSCVLIHSCGKIKGKILIKKLEKGKPIHSRYLTVCRGENVHISFDGPVSLRTDGELQTGVAGFTAFITL